MLDKRKKKGTGMAEGFKEALRLKAAASLLEEAPQNHAEEETVQSVDNPEEGIMNATGREINGEGCAVVPPIKSPMVKPSRQKPRKCRQKVTATCEKAETEASNAGIVKETCAIDAASSAASTSRASPFAIVHSPDKVAVEILGAINVHVPDEDHVSQAVRIEVRRQLHRAARGGIEPKNCARGKVGPIVDFVVSIGKRRRVIWVVNGPVACGLRQRDLDGGAVAVGQLLGIKSKRFNLDI